MRILAPLIVCFALAGCDDTTTVSCQNSEALDQATLEVVVQKLGPSPYEDDFKETQAGVDRQRSAIDAFGHWAETVRDSCTKSSYEGWIWYYNLKLDRLQQEVRSHKRRDDYEAFLKTDARISEAARGLEKTIERP